MNCAINLLPGALEGHMLSENLIIHQSKWSEWETQGHPSEIKRYN